MELAECGAFRDDVAVSRIPLHSIRATEHVFSRSQAPLRNVYLQALLDVVNCSCHAKQSLVIGIPKLEFGNEIHDFHSSHRSSMGTHRNAPALRDTTLERQLRHSNARALER